MPCWFSCPPFAELDEVVSVDDGEAILMAQMLAAQLGLGVGISSGANLLEASDLKIIAAPTQG